MPFSLLLFFLSSSSFFSLPKNKLHPHTLFESQIQLHSLNNPELFSSILANNFNPLLFPINQIILKMKASFIALLGVAATVSATANMDHSGPMAMPLHGPCPLFTPLTSTPSPPARPLSPTAPPEWARLPLTTSPSTPPTAPSLPPSQCCLCRLCRQCR